MAFNMKVNLLPFSVFLLCCVSVARIHSLPTIDTIATTLAISENEIPKDTHTTTATKDAKDVSKMTTVNKNKTNSSFDLSSPCPFLLQLEMLDYFNYPNEKHTVITSDGYILEIHRIPHPGQPPILLSHGVLSSSADFLVMGPNQSLAFLLHDQQYDVWLFNYRGNRYSRNHVTLNPNSSGSKFWQFSMHEIATIDLSATVDYIITSTGQPRLYYTGHSMGTMIFWILLSEQPKYNDKFHLMQALAPVAYLGHIESKIMRQIVKTMDTMEVLFTMNGIQELFAHSTFERASKFTDLCLASLANVCFPVMEDVVGEGLGELNKTVLSTVFGHFPAGTSLRVFEHTAQLVQSKRFAKYDWGSAAENQKLYGYAAPPSYNLKNTRVPVCLHYGTEDGIVALKDVDILASEMESVVERNEIYGYNHLDFLYSFESTRGLYAPMLRTFNAHRERVRVSR